MASAADPGFFHEDEIVPLFYSQCSSLISVSVNSTAAVEASATGRSCFPQNAIPSATNRPTAADTGVEVAYSTAGKVIAPSTAKGM